MATRYLLVIFLLVGNVLGIEVNFEHHRRQATQRRDDGHWISTWTGMPQLVEPGNMPPAPFTQSSSSFVNATIRQTLRVTQGGDTFRLTISNAFGTTNLPVTAVTISLSANNTAGTSEVVATALIPVTFSGSPSFDVPNGALVISDPIQLKGVKAKTILSVSIYLASGQQTTNLTGHPGSRTTIWMANGNLVNATSLNGGPNLASTAHWYLLGSLEVWAPKTATTVAIIGDSITDGRGSTTDANDRWPDQVFDHLQNTSSSSLLKSIAFINQAAGGNRLLIDGLGPNVLSRIDRDVLAQPGVTYAILFEGVNDIGTTDTTSTSQAAVGDRVIAAYKQISARIRGAGIPLFGATITPLSAPGGSAQQPYSDPEREKTRQKVNAFIRNSGGVFDAVLDFDQILRDPAVPSQLKDEYNSGDYLHPNVAGYKAIADAFPVEVFEKFKDGVSGW
ncbi:SGNH hydrolase-type esterase domain-containing protein [Flagelloscypha sp. PMI_526]|nr:SGNH hydrolase-type esterase domain-containing protein [Flagelloscypha sp. PMI_526]